MGALSDLGFGNILGGFNGGSFVSQLVIGAIAMIFLTGVGVIVFVWIRDKMVYKYPVSLIAKKENGGHKRRDDLRGGLVKGRSGVADFSIKIPKKFKKKKLGFVPDFSLANSEDRLSFITSGDGVIWQQCQEHILEDEEYEIKVLNKKGQEETRKLKSRLLIEPIPTDIKTITINNIHAAENLLESNKLKAASIAIGAFVLMVLVQIIFLFLVNK